MLAGARHAAGAEADRGGWRRRSTHRMEGHRHQLIGRVHLRGAHPQATPVQGRLPGCSGRRILRTRAVRGPDRPGHRYRPRRPPRPRFACRDRRPWRRHGTHGGRAQGHRTKRRDTEGRAARGCGSRGCGTRGYGSRGIPRLGRDQARHTGWHAEGRADHGPASACPGRCRTRSAGGQLRYLLSRGSRTAISSVHPAASHHPGPGPDLPVSGMPTTSLALGPGPLDPIPPGRAHVLVQSGASLSQASSSQTGEWLATGTTRPRLLHLDHALRAPVRRDPRGIPHLTAPAHGSSIRQFHGPVRPSLRTPWLTHVCGSRTSMAHARL